MNTCREWPSSRTELLAVRTSLEGLIIRHAIIPFRAQYLGATVQEKLPAQDAPNALKDDLFNALRIYRFPGTEKETDTRDYEVERTILKTRKYLTVAFTSALFELALNSHSPTAPGERRSERPWLEKLFTQLTGSVALLLPHASPTQAQKEYVRLLKWMLQQSKAHELRLGIGSLESILYQTSGLFIDKGEDRGEQVNWDIVSLCLLNDANVFTLPSSSSDDRGRDFAYRTPNKYLSSLFWNLTHSGLSLTVDNDSWHDITLKEVIIPLSGAFSDARDLSGFLEHWREQLEQQDPLTHTPNIWEDELLIRHVSRLIEQILTADQIDHILSAAISRFKSSLAVVHVQKSSSKANLVILDCISAVHLPEDRLSRLAKSVTSFYVSIDRILSADSPQISPHRWRLWRIQSGLTDHWITLIDLPVFKDKAQIRMNGALELLMQIPNESPSPHKNDFTEELHAFRYMMSFEGVPNAFWKGSGLLPRQKIQSAITRLLDIMESFCHRTSNNFFEIVKDDIPITQTNISSARVISRGSFYINGLLCAIACKKALRSASPPTIIRSFT